MTVIANRFSELTELLPRFEKKSGSQIQSAALVIAETFISGNKVLICGNGGSASTASHYITDWNKMVNLATGKKFRGISLCDNNTFFLSLRFCFTTLAIAFYILLVIIFSLKPDRLFCLVLFWHLF